MKINKFNILTRLLIFSALVFGLAACGGGGSAPAGVTTPTTPTTPSGVGNSDPSAALPVKLEPGIGKLIPEVRTNGYSARYTTDADYKTLVDAVTAGSAEVLGLVGDLIKWPENIPAVFSGCGAKNAFFGGNFDMHAFLTKEGVADPTLTFGNNNIGAMLVMCHEITEANVAYFLKPETIAAIETNFNADTEDKRAEALTLSLLIFEWQVMFHEVGHGLDQMLLKDDANNTTKKQFKIPLLNTCNSPTTPCDTIGEDFADWISSSIIISIIEDAIEDEPAMADQYLGALFTALDAWEGVLGEGGGAVHSKLESRQINMACYAYGGIPALKTADANSGNKLGTFLATKLGDIAVCDTNYQFNDNLTDTLLGQYIKNEPDGGTGTGGGSGSGSGTESEPNNDGATANTIVSTITGSVHGSVDAQEDPIGPDPFDGFKFTPPSSNSYTVTLTWTGAADLDFVVLDGQENLISNDGAQPQGVQPETASVNLTAGVPVFIRVQGFETSGSAVNYTLTIQ